MQRLGKRGYNCARNELNVAGHIWDRRDGEAIGATACIVIPRFWDAFQDEGDWQRLAWWIHDHLPYASLEFFKPFWAFNINWRDRNPPRTISSFAFPAGCLTRPGMANHDGSHEAEWAGIEKAML